MDLLSRMPRRLFAPIALVVVLGGCDLLRDPTRVEGGEALVMVHAVLEAGVGTVRVLLESSEPARDTIRAAMRPISGAQLRIAEEGAEGVVLMETAAGFPACRPPGHSQGDILTQNGAGCYAGELAGGVRGGVRYTLSIRLPDGRDAAGEVVVPRAPEIVAPAAEARIRIARHPTADFGYVPVPLRVRLPAEAGAVQAYVAASTVYLGGGGVPAQCPTYGVQRLSAADTLTLGIPSPLRCTVGGGSNTRIIEPDSVLAQLHVLAYDSAYARYERALSENTLRPQTLSLGARGVYGVFAASARTSRAVMLVQER